MPRGLSTKELEELVENLSTEGLLKEVNGEKRIRLEPFNENLKKASENLGIIVPDIIEISKEQVALINHGLEGVINFMRTFQTVNTSFAVMAENPDKIGEFSDDFDNIRLLENKIVKEVKNTLVNLDEMLRETFKETAVYYKALGQIIYSEEEGEIKIKFEEEISSELKKKMDEIYKRDRRREKESFKKGKGLIQLITALEKVSKKVRDIDDDSIKYYETKSAKENMRIKLDKSVFEALKGFRDDLLDSLNRVGLLLKDEEGTMRKIKDINFEANLMAQYGKNNMEQLEKALEEKENVVDYFIKRVNKIVNLEKLQKEVEGEESADIYKRINKFKKQKNQAKEEHDKIVKDQIKFIHKVVKAFTRIVALWGDQVDNEIHIGQVADKAVIAMKKLGEVQTDIDPEVGEQALLIARDTQKEIDKTCEKAKDLKNVGKVMQFLLKRVKHLVSFNESIEAQIQSYYSENEKADEYKRRKVEKIKDLINNKYPDMKEGVSESINKFNKQLEELTDDRNTYENIHLFKEFSQYYEWINKAFKYFLNKLRVASEDVNVSNFEEYCSDLGVTMDKLEDQIDVLFENFNGLKKTFTDDFERYKKISNAYQEFVEEVGEMLDLMNYVTNVEEKLAREEIDLKTLNMRIRAFQDVFDDLKKVQKEQAEVNEDLKRIMREVGMIDRDYYGEYMEKLGKELSNLYKRLDEFVQEMYFTQEKMEQAYKEVEVEIKRFKVDFKDYQDKLKGMNVGFFQKLFKTQSYKKSKFWEKLNDIKDSFEEFDKKMEEAKKIELKLDKKEEIRVKRFCESSVLMVNEIMKALNEVVEELYEVSGTMEFVVSNLKELTREGYLKDFSELLEEFKTFDERVEKIEEEEFDLEEFERFNVKDMINSLKRVTEFDELSDELSEEAQRMKEYTKIIKENSEDVRVALLIFFYTYLTKVYSGEKKKEYEKALAKVKK